MKLDGTGKRPEYSGLWTFGGFFRNLVFNGWHPIVPWLSFFLIGALLSRCELDSRRVQVYLLLAGAGTFAVVTALSGWLTGWADSIDQELRYFFTTDPVPPMPLFVAAGAGAACAVTGLCLLLEPPLRSLRLLGWLTPAGRQTLSLYIAHIVLATLQIIHTSHNFGIWSYPQSIFEYVAVLV